MEIIVFLGTLGAAFAGTIAAKKKRNPFGWCVLGFLFPLPAIVVATQLKPPTKFEIGR